MSDVIPRSDLSASPAALPPGRRAFSLRTPSNRRSWLIVSDLIGRLEVRCEVCQRRGVYLVDRLLTEVGDLALIEALMAIARKGGCARAANPPETGDILGARCQIKRESK